MERGEVGRKSILLLLRTWRGEDLDEKCERSSNIYTTLEISTLKARVIPSKSQDFRLVMVLRAHKTGMLR